MCIRLYCRLLMVSMLVGFMLCGTSVQGMSHKKHLIGDHWDIKTVSDVGMSEITSRHPYQSNKPMGKMSAYDDTEQDDDNDFESASTMSYDKVSVSLLDDKDIKKYIKRLYLEITPINYVELYQHAENPFKKSVFNRFDEGVFVQWKSSHKFDYDQVSSLLALLKSIRKFKVSVEWDKPGVSFTDLIADCVQGFKNLEEMDLSNLRLNDDDMLMILESTASRQLTKLIIYGNAITESILPEIQDKFKKLKQLKTDISNTSTNVSPMSMPGMQLGNMTSLSTKTVDSIVERQKALEVEKMRFQLEAEEAEQKLQQEIADARQKESEAAAKKHQEDAFAKAAQKAVAQQQKQLTLENPLKSSVPNFARGYEAVYNRFINGKLVFRSNEEKGITVNTPKEFSFTQFASTLSGEFDLTGLTCTCNNKTYKISDYLRIKLGYRTEQENDDKVTCWIVPKFVVETALMTKTKGGLFSRIMGKKSRAAHYDSIMGNWTSDVGLFWSYDNWDLTDYAYLTNKQFDEISSQNLYDLRRGGRWVVGCATLLFESSALIFTFIFD